MTPFLHVSSEPAGYLQLAKTVATWYASVDDDDLRALASDVLEHLHARRWSRAHDACVDLMNLAVLLGLKACFVIDRYVTESTGQALLPWQFALTLLIASAVLAGASFLTSLAFHSSENVSGDAANKDER